MTIEKNKEMARQSLQEVWTNGRFDLIDELFTEEFVQHHTAAGPDLEDRAEYRSFIKALCEAMPNMKTSIYEIVADGEAVVLHYGITGTHTNGRLRGVEPTNQILEWDGMIWYRFHDGQIAEAWIQYDELGMLSQIGVVSPPEPGESVEP